MSMELSNIDDPSLWKEIQSGDNAAFAVFFNKHWDRLFSFAYKLLKDYDDAQDVVQAVYISVWERRAQIEFTDSAESYLFQAVRFQSLKKLNQLLSNPESVDRIQQHLLPVFNEIWERLGQKELFEEIEERLSVLPGKTKEIFLLSRRYQLTITEIAERLGLSEKTVRNQLHIALKALRHSIAISVIVAELTHVH